MYIYRTTNLFDIEILLHMDGLPLRCGLVLQISSELPWNYSESLRSPLMLLLLIDMIQQPY